MSGGGDETSDRLVRDGANVGDSEWGIGGSERSVDFVEGRSGEKGGGVFLAVNLYCGYSIMSLLAAGVCICWTLRPPVPRQGSAKEEVEKNAYLDGPPQPLHPHQPPVRTRQVRR